MIHNKIIQVPSLDVIFIPIYTLYYLYKNIYTQENSECPQECDIFLSYVELASPFCTNAFDIDMHIDMYMLHLLDSVPWSVITTGGHI